MQVEFSLNYRNNVAHNSRGIQSPCQMMIGVYSHIPRKVFRFHYHSQKVIGSLGLMSCWLSDGRNLATNPGSFVKGIHLVLLFSMLIVEKRCIYIYNYIIYSDVDSCKNVPCYMAHFHVVKQQERKKKPMKQLYI